MFLLGVLLFHKGERWFLKEVWMFPLESEVYQRNGLVARVEGWITGERILALYCSALRSGEL